MTITSLSDSVRFGDNAEDISISAASADELWNLSKNAERVFQMFLVMPPTRTVRLNAETPIDYSADDLPASDIGYITLHKVPTDNYKGSHFYPELDEGDLPDVVGLCSLDLAIAVSVYL